MNALTYRTYATILGTLMPLFCSACFAQHCTNQSWTQLLNKQHQVEHWYNHNTMGFNELLNLQEHQVFMNKEFTDKELRSFWHPNKTELHQKLNDQIESSTYLSELLLDRTHLIREKMDEVSGLTLAWKEMSIHCLKANLALNYQTSQNNVSTSESLLQDLATLESKYDALRHRYEQEALSLKNSKP